MSISVNGEKINAFNFPGGECHVRVNPKQIKQISNITAKLDCSDAIMRLLLAVDAIRRINPNTEIHLTIPYFPYARQDRVCNTGEAFSAEVMINLINQLHAHSVTIMDPHSDVIVNGLNNCKVVTLTDIILGSALETAIKQNTMTLISPDKGAEKKVTDLAMKLETTPLYAKKTRNIASGRITHSSLDGDVTDKHCIILDDICDGGSTFVELAKLLQEKGAKKLYLYVTHGIFSRGLDLLRPYFEQIYCHHVFLNDEQIDAKYLHMLEDKDEIH